MPRTPKGEVSIIDKNGWVQLRWNYQGKRCYLSPGLLYDPINLKVAEQRAAQIRLDILSGNYDPTLTKYQTESGGQSGGLSAVKLFDKFTEWKSKRVQKRTLEKYRGLITWLREYFGDRAAKEEDADQFINWLMQNLEPGTAKERLGLLKAAWDWGLKNNLVRINPWEELNIRKPPKQRPKAFSKTEMRQIIEGFEESQYYQHYADYVRFKFTTGCRSGEANGLRWRHLNEDCSVAWIGETHTHGEFKETKTGKAREVKLSDSTAAMLRSRLKDNDLDDLVFPAPKGGAIDEHNFSKRAWTKVLLVAGIPYRKPYNTRHTFISHCLGIGMHPVEVALITGHDVQTLYENYAGLIKSHPKAPEIL
ncbi:MAG: tyrosine-type recombinase/integrase [Cyanobacteria bacterium P01_F01_bin.3]